MGRPSIMADSSQLTDHKGLEYDLTNYRWRIVIDVEGEIFRFGSFVMDDVAASGHDIIMDMLGLPRLNNSVADITSPEVRQIVSGVRERISDKVALKTFPTLADVIPKLVKKMSVEINRRPIKQLTGQSQIEQFIAANGDIELYFNNRLQAWMGIAIPGRISSLCVYTLQDFGPDRGMR